LGCEPGGVETHNASQAIFVAPEYLFVDQCSRQRRAAMRVSSKDRLVSSLRSISAKITYIPRVSGVREVGNFTFGIEICFDHANHTLKGKKADFHIVVSDYTDTNPDQNVGTYLLPASTHPDQTGVWQSASAVKMPTATNMVPDDNTLDYWLCPIDARP
jgi:hypothetical protein